MLSVNLIPGDIPQIQEVGGEFETLFQDALNSVAATKRNNGKFTVGGPMGGNVFAGRAVYNPSTKSMDITIQEGGVVSEISGDKYTNVVLWVVVDSGFSVGGIVSSTLSISRPATKT